MNCPGACLVFGSTRHSYRELPLRLAEFGLVTRDEREGVLHGLLRVRAFTQDDAHVYCTEEQIVDEVRDIVETIDELYAMFGFEDVRVELSTRPEKSIGTDEQWATAEGALREALDDDGPRVPAEPRRRSLLRPQDRLPRDRRARPLLAARHLPARLLHAAALRPHLHRRRRQGPDAGDDPPRAARLDRALRRHPDRALRRQLPGLAGAGAGAGAADRRSPRATSPSRSPTISPGRGVRVDVDRRSESVGRKIRDAELAKIPYMLVVGDAEQEASKLAVRRHGEGESGSWTSATLPIWWVMRADTPAASLYSPRCGTDP